MDLNDLIPIFGILLVMIPVAGLTLTFTIRLALKPFVETISKALRDSRVSSNSEVAAQIEDLASQMHELSAHLMRLERAQEFDRQLLGTAKDDTAS